ncbi:MAG: hypothetical protein CL940_01400 [Deltaproteobacteria bacterium]|nr:hypothetical protein [Deltaproteobacteria bacterium]
MTDRKAQPADDSLALWSLATGVAGVGFMVYLPLGALPRFAGFSENPWVLTTLMGICGVASVLGAWRRRHTAQVLLRRTLLFGAFLAVMGNLNYAHYVYYYSHTVPDAELAPKIGERAPDFTVPDPSGGAWSLKAFEGTPFLLVFYRAHW